MFNRDVLTLYHGSYDPISIGTVMSLKDIGRNDKDWSNEPYNILLEKHRPPGFLPRDLSIFACLDIDDIDCAGGYIDYVYKVKPMKSAVVSRHDVSWCTELNIIMDREGEFSSISDYQAEIQKACLSYWLGLPKDENPVWEFLMAEAHVVEEV